MQRPSSVLTYITKQFALASVKAPQPGGTSDAYSKASVCGALCCDTAFTCRAANCLADYGAAVVIEATHTGELRRKAPDEEEDMPPLTRRHSLDNWHDLRELTDANTRRRSMDVRFGCQSAFNITSLIPMRR